MINIPKEMIVVFAMIFGLYLLVLLSIISDLVSGECAATMRRRTKRRNPSLSSRRTSRISRLSRR